MDEKQLKLDKGEFTMEVPHLKLTVPIKPKGKKQHDGFPCDFTFDYHPPTPYYYYEGWEKKSYSKDKTKCR